MEQHPQFGEQNEQQQAQEQIGQQINQDIRDAAYDGRAIAHVTAKRIAKAIQPGSGPLYDFTTTGAVADEIYSELYVAREVVPELLSWVAALEDYCLSRLYQGQVPGWQEIATEVTAKERIYYGITEALQRGQAIDHATARTIAAQLHSGQTSALYALASSGAMVDGLSAEVDLLRHTADTEVSVELWLDALDEYIGNRESTDQLSGGKS